MRLLLELQQRARQNSAMYAERLEDFVLRCRDAGGSARGIADALGVGSTTVQQWTANARRRGQGGADVER